MLEVVVGALLAIATAGVGYLAGYRRGIEDGAEAAEDRLRQIDPPRRTAGAPANMEADPSDVRQTRWRTGVFKSGPHTEE